MEHPNRFKPCGCMAHPRRKLVDACEHQPTQARDLVLQMRRLYLFEKHAREESTSPEQSQQLRQQIAVPILAQMKERLLALQPSVLPQIPLDKTVNYALAEWESLNR